MTEHLPGSNRFNEKSKRLLIGFSTLVVCASFVFLTLPISGYNFPILLLLLLFPLTWASVKGQISIRLEKDDKYLLALLAIFFVFYLANLLLRPEATRLFDRNLRWLVFIAVFFVLLAYPPKKSWVLGSILLGSFAAGIFALIEKNATGTTRVGEHINPIQFGSFSMLLALLSVVLTNYFFIAWIKNKQAKLLLSLSLLSLLCALLGLFASIASGTRGGWLTAPLFIFIVYKQYSSELGLSKRHLIIPLLLTLLIGLHAYKTPRLNIESRVMLGVHEFKAYFDRRTIATSVGARLEMWRIAGSLAIERPILGWGHQGYQDQISILVESKQTDSFLQQFNEPHNQFLDSAAKHGIFGLILILTLYVWPAKIFLNRYKKNAGSQQSLFAILGGVSMLAFFDFSLTHSFINKTGGLMVFLFILVLFWKLSDPYIYKPKKENR